MNPERHAKNAAERKCQLVNAAMVQLGHSSYVQCDMSAAAVASARAAAA
eukprot:CAMPEP_0172666750 /NCGR_PEP_ID=MMETSP1074-20121228/7999_1 /TAXON_ID=2916 /ORGANISM="Ceratium fusus, Strain PA161109" /LENGTH=48 /DNA_ID= /DNA_START= /DNA_END= /DNA_ORIENTATION=